MSHVASLELSRILFELSGWKDTHFSWRSQNKQEPRIVDIAPNIDSDIPAYSLGELLRKLPEYMMRDGLSRSLCLYKANSRGIGWIAKYGGTRTFKGEIMGNSMKSPEDAAAKLCIKLFRQGILKKGES